MCVLAIDIGTKYCGLAIGLSNNKLFPLQTIKFNNNIQLLHQELQKIARSYPKIKYVVLGKTSYKTTQELEQNVYTPLIKQIFQNAKITYINEDFSTQFAQTLITLENNLQNISRRKRKKAKQRGIIDSASALILLQKAYEKNTFTCN